MKKRTLKLFVLTICIMAGLLFGAGAVNAAFFHTVYGNGIQQADDATLQAKYTSWLGWFYTAQNGYHRVNYPEGLACGGNCASEGIGYGLLLAVWNGDQTTFNELWNFKTTVSPRLNLMAWCINGGGIIDQNSATDADVDIAMALLLAHRRWGDAGAINYGSLATTEINKVASSDVCATSYNLYPGDYCSCVSNDNTYPSYFTPAWYTEFGAQTGNTTFWDGVKTKAYSMLSGSRNAATGLDTEQITYAGAAISNLDGYNSARIPWRYSLDYVWNGTANSLAQITLDSTFFTGKSGNCAAIYQVNGTVSDGTYNGMRVGGAACSQMIAGKASELTLYYTAASATYNDPGHFYNSTLALLALVQMSGNCPKVFGNTPTPQNTPSGDLFDDCEDGDNQDNWGGFWYTYFDRGPLNYGTSYVVPNPVSWYTMAGMVPTPFWMQAAVGMGGSYAAHMTGVVTTVYTYGFVGMGAGTNQNSGRMTFTSVDVSGYTGIRFKMKASTATDLYDFKVTCGNKAVTSTGDNDWKYTFTGTTAMSVITVPFTSFTQAVGWGIPTSWAIIAQHMTDVQWQTNGQPKPSIDLWVDDIEFYPAKPPTPTPTYCPGQLFDNLSDGDSTNLFGGYWYTYKDANGSTIVPSTAVTFTASAPGNGGTGYGANINGSLVNVAASFGGMGSTLNPTNTARNMSAFVGITFWAQGDGNWYSAKLKAIPSINTGNNDWKYTFKSVNGTWTQYTIPFAIFTQEGGWGFVVPLATILTNLAQVQFETKGINHTYNLWVDDIVFNCTQNWTPTRTPMVGTATFTPVITNTYTRTPTVSSTFTRTVTPQITSTFTATPSFTSTRTNTPVANSPTFTLTQTSTSTRTNTPQANTPTFTSTLVNTSTFTSTRTATSSATGTSTRTNTPVANTPTFTSTLVNTPTFTYTRTATASASPTFTRTNTPSANSPTFTSTSSNTFTATSTRTDTPIVPSATYTLTRTSTLTGTPTNTGTATRTGTPTFTITNTGTIAVGSPTDTATSSRTMTVSPTSTRTGTSTNTATSTRTATSSRTPTFTLVVTATFTSTINVAATDTPTNTETTAVTDTYTATPVCACATAFGKQTLPSYGAYDESTFFDSNRFTLVENAVVRSLSAYITTSTGGSMRMALYTDLPGAPGTLIVESVSQPSVAGWNTFDIPDTVLAPGVYWIAWQVQAGTIMGYDQGAAGDEVYVGMPYGAFPATPPGGFAVDAAVFTVRADYCPVICGSPTDTPTPSPTFTASATPYPCACAAELGMKYMGPYQASGFGWLQANWYGMPEDGIANSMEIYVKSGSGNARLAIYSNSVTGTVAAQPQDLIVESSEFPVQVGWNIVSIPLTALQANTIYWLGFQTQNASILVAGDNGSAGDLYYIAAAYGAFPAAFGGGAAFTSDYSEFVNYCPLLCGTVTNTPVVTATNTPVPTSTNTQVVPPTATATLVPGGSITSIIKVPSSAVVGQLITVTMDVNNTGMVDINSINPSALVPSDPAAVTIVSTPVVPMNLASGTGGTFTWVYTVIAVSPTLSFSGNASGQNAITLATVSSSVASSSSFGCVMPTATVTQTRTATATRTVTATFTSTLTVTMTNTPLPPTATYTPAAAPTSTVLKFSDKEASVTAFPNPGLIDASGALTAPLSLQFSLTRSEPATIVAVKIYTTAARLIKSYTKTLSVSTAPDGKLIDTVTLTGNELDGLAQGIYYYVVIVSDSTASNVKSKIEKLIILKK